MLVTCHICPLVQGNKSAARPLTSQQSDGWQQDRQSKKGKAFSSCVEKENKQIHSNEGKTAFLEDSGAPVGQNIKM